MPTHIVECIPNFSEGKRLDVIKEITQSINSINGIHILDKHSDVDHNRSVITFVGEPSSVEEAAFLAIKTAKKLIDLNHHKGAHPRIGATDVVPFVPLNQSSMEECIDLARHLGKRVGEELNIPVYLYEEAAIKPERRNLEYIRRGGYEVLCHEITSNPERQPDFGPLSLGSAGATVIGARNSLIAFNVYLTTDDVSIAKKIAKAIRNSSGGLRFVKALGLLVSGRAQVSMNITNFQETPIERVVELIRSEVSRYGARIHHSELIGLIPQSAITNVSSWYLQLDDFSSDRILEHQLYNISSQHNGLYTPSIPYKILDDLANGKPSPGGGSAAALTGAAAAALIAMVCRLTIGRKNYSLVEEKMQILLEKAETIRTDLSSKIHDDAEAFETFLTIRNNSHTKISETNNNQKIINDAITRIISIQLDIATQSLEIIKMALQLAKDGNKNAIADTASAATLARSAFMCAMMNIRDNLVFQRDSQKTLNINNQMQLMEQETNNIFLHLRYILKERSNLILP